MRYLPTRFTLPENSKLYKYTHKKKRGDRQAQKRFQLQKKPAHSGQTNRITKNLLCLFLNQTIQHTKPTKSSGCLH